MSKIGLITKREYITRVRKKTFIIMTILGPILMAALVVVPAWLTTQKDDSEKVIAVIDNTDSFNQVLEETGTLKFEFIKDLSLEQLKAVSKEADYYAVLTIPNDVRKEKITLYSYKQPSIEVNSYISKSIENEIERQNYQKLNINVQTLDSAKANIDIEVYKWSENGETEKSSTEVVMIIGMISAFLIYMFIFMYGAQVMRGVIEEKTSRVVEIIISSVKPFELMMGKILGIALVALTQFVAWIIFTIAIVMFVQPLLISKDLTNKQDIVQNISNPNQITQISNNSEVSDIFAVLGNLDYGMIIFCFLFYFIGGYLLYASLFAAIGGAVDNETDTQQFMLPLTIPLILAMTLSQVIIQNPDGAISFWFSIIPLTSPVVMMVRVAFGVPEAVSYWQLILSMVLLVLSFIGSTWLAGKIYRTGILMYGKKITYKELWKWLKYKN